MSAVFVTLDPILDVNPLEFADWCATEPTEPSTAPVDIDARWSHHVRESSLDSSNLLFVLLIDQDENGQGNQDYPLSYTVCPESSENFANSFLDRLFKKA